MSLLSVVQGTEHCKGAERFYRSFQRLCGQICLDSLHDSMGWIKREYVGGREVR